MLLHRKDCYSAVMVSLMLGLGSFFGVAGMVVAARRGLFGEYASYQAPVNFCVACTMFMNAARRDRIAPWLFLAGVWAALAWSVVEFGKALRTRRLHQNAMWAGAALSGAICALTIGRIPYSISELLALLTLLAGLACFIYWFTQLPRSSRTSSP
jgi:hypothetical protein